MHSSMALILPPSAEDGAEPILYPDGVAKFFFDCIDASLRDIRPYAQDVREICNFDHAHLALPDQV